MIGYAPDSFAATTEASPCAPAPTIATLSPYRTSPLVRTHRTPFPMTEERQAASAGTSGAIRWSLLPGATKRYWLYAPHR